MKLERLKEVLRQLGWDTRIYGFHGDLLAMFNSETLLQRNLEGTDKIYVTFTEFEPNDAEYGKVMFEGRIEYPKLSVNTVAIPEGQEALYLKTLLTQYAALKKAVKEVSGEV